MRIVTTAVYFDRDMPAFTTADLSLDGSTRRELQGLHYVPTQGTPNPDAAIAIRQLQDIVMGLVLADRNTSIVPFDTTYALASVGGSATSTLETTTGKGSSTIVVAGDGDVDVTIKYSIDGAADVPICTSEKDAVVTVAFAVSLVIKAVNGNAGAKNRASVSSTGVKQ